MNTAVSGSERMRQLINDLLQYAHIDARQNELKEVDLTVVTEKVRDELDVAINEAKAQVIIEPLPTVMANEAQMTLLLQNLLNNAIRFRGPEPPKIVVFAQKGVNEWIIAVQDNGIGIDPKYRGNLFKMFQRLHTQEQYPAPASASLHLGRSSSGTAGGYGSRARKERKHLLLHHPTVRGGEEFRWVSLSTYFSLRTARATPS